MKESSLAGRPVTEPLLLDAVVVPWSAICGSRVLAQNLLLSSLGFAVLVVSSPGSTWSQALESTITLALSFDTLTPEAHNRLQNKNKNKKPNPKFAGMAVPPPPPGNPPPLGDMGSNPMEYRPEGLHRKILDYALYHDDPDGEMGDGLLEAFTKPKVVGDSIENREKWGMPSRHDQPEPELPEHLKQMVKDRGEDLTSSERLMYEMAGEMTSEEQYKKAADEWTKHEQFKQMRKYRYSRVRWQPWKDDDNIGINARNIKFNLKLDRMYKKAGLDPDPNHPVPFHRRGIV